jgi:exodeoxyribonuclease VII small subunit
MAATPKTVSGTAAGTPPTGVAELSYSDAGAELDAIIDEFETGVVDVDRLVDQLERATEIVDELDRRLRRTRMQVEELVPRLEAIGQVDSFEQEVEDAEVGTETPAPAPGAAPGLF